MSDVMKDAETAEAQGAKIDYKVVVKKMCYEGIVPAMQYITELTPNKVDDVIVDAADAVGQAILK